MATEEEASRETTGAKSAESAGHELTPKEVAAYKDMFKTLDRNQSGLIDLADLGYALQMFNQCPTKADLENIIHAYKEEEEGDDAAPNSSVDFETFCTIMKEHSDTRDNLLNRIIDAFGVSILRGIFEQLEQHFDPQQAGLVEASQLREALLTIGEVFTEQEANEFFKDAGISPDGKVAYDDFCKKLVDSFPRPASKAGSRKPSGKKK
ncbi:hypothetical protein Ciccas_013988 [Cichlidogyrus casuarinus]|uniref:EF-hand domain-containing protein n=1 Tax=Cichlidogyrus casuarinus TaxID=1844966 RepID=A0ABD2PK76_9PLAT